MYVVLTIRTVGQRQSILLEQNLMHTMIKIIQSNNVLSHEKYNKRIRLLYDFVFIIKTYSCREVNGNMLN
jgi:hypothetical protein